MKSAGDKPDSPVVAVSTATSVKAQIPASIVADVKSMFAPKKT